MSALAYAIPFPCRTGWVPGPRTGYPHPALPCRCEHPLFDADAMDHCVRCGHETVEAISKTFEQQALRTSTAGGRLATAA